MWKIVPVKIGSVPYNALTSHDRDSFRACETRAFRNFVGVRRIGNNRNRWLLTSCADFIAAALGAK
jgi:hypothetical protein